MLSRFLTVFRTESYFHTCNNLIADYYHYLASRENGKSNPRWVWRRLFKFIRFLAIAAPENIIKSPYSTRRYIYDKLTTYVLVFAPPSTAEEALFALDAADVWFHYRYPADAKKALEKVFEEEPLPRDALSFGFEDNSRTIVINVKNQFYNVLATKIPKELPVKILPIRA